MKIGTIETERLILRKMIPSDDEAMFILDSNPNVYHYLGNKPITDDGITSIWLELTKRDHLK